MPTKAKLQAEIDAGKEALEAEKQKGAAAAKAHDDKVKELSAKIKELEDAAAASTKESAATVADAAASEAAGGALDALAEQQHRHQYS